MTTTAPAPNTTHEPPALAMTKASLKTWWNSFTFAQRAKKDAEEKRAANAALAGAPSPEHVVFGKPLKESLKHASVQISTANANGELYVWGYIPVVVAKWCVAVSADIFVGSTLSWSSLLFQRVISEGEWCVRLMALRLEHVIEGGAATEVEGTFRVNGSNKRMRELQAAFETPPRVRPNSSHPTQSFLITHTPLPIPTGHIFGLLAPQNTCFQHRRSTPGIRFRAVWEES